MANDPDRDWAPAFRAWLHQIDPKNPGDWCPDYLAAARVPFRAGWRAAKRGPARVFVASGETAECTGTLSPTD